MGIKVGLGSVSASVGQSHGFDKTMKYGNMLSRGVDTSKVSINTFTSTLKNSLLNLSAYVNNVSTSNAYLETVKSEAEVLLSEFDEMMQLALQSQNASATNRLALQAVLEFKQKTIAQKIVSAEFGGVNLFTNSTDGNNLIIGNGLNLDARIDSARGVSLINTAGIAASITSSGNSRNKGSNVTDVDVELKIYGEATLSLANAGVISAGDLLYLSSGTVAALNFYTGGGPSPATQGSIMAIGSTSGAAGVLAGDNFKFTTINMVVVDFFGSLDLSTFGVGSTVINDGVFKLRMTGLNVPNVNDIKITNFAMVNTPQVGAIGNITIGDGTIVSGTACTIDTIDNAIIATNVIRVAMDQISSMIRRIDNLVSSLSGISQIQLRTEESIGSSVEELTAVDITECMSEIVAGQNTVQYTTAVWSGQQKLYQLILSVFQQAVA